MTHMAIAEHRDGTTVQWMEKVSDAQYNGEVQSEPQRQPSHQQQRTAGPSGEQS